MVHGGPERSWATKGSGGPVVHLVHCDPFSFAAFDILPKMSTKADQGGPGGPGGPNPPWWTKTGFYILQMWCELGIMSDLICLLTQPSRKAAVVIILLSTLGYPSAPNVSPFVQEGSPKKEIHAMLIEVPQCALQESSRGRINFDGMLVSYITILREDIYTFFAFEKFTIILYHILLYPA